MTPDDLSPTGSKRDAVQIAFNKIRDWIHAHKFSVKQFCALAGPKGEDAEIEEKDFDRMRRRGTAWRDVAEKVALKMRCTLQNITLDASDTAAVHVDEEILGMLCKHEWFMYHYTRGDEGSLLIARTLLTIDRAQTCTLTYRDLSLVFTGNILFEPSRRFFIAVNGRVSGEREQAIFRGDMRIRAGRRSKLELVGLGVDFKGDTLTTVAVASAREIPPAKIVRELASVKHAAIVPPHTGKPKFFTRETDFSR